MKLCPFCAEEIQEAAIKCKHCGEMLSASPSDPSPVPAPEPTPAPAMPLAHAVETPIAIQANPAARRRNILLYWAFGIVWLFGLEYTLLAILLSVCVLLYLATGYAQPELRDAFDAWMHRRPFKAHPVSIWGIVFFIGILGMLTHWIAAGPGRGDGSMAVSSQPAAGNAQEQWAAGELQRFRSANFNVMDVEASGSTICIYFNDDVTGPVPELAMGSADRFKESFPDTHPTVIEYARDGKTLGRW